MSIPLELIVTSPTWFRAAEALDEEVLERELTRLVDLRYPRQMEATRSRQTNRRFPTTSEARSLFATAPLPSGGLLAD